MPFLIDWGTTRHPAESDLPLVGLVSLTIGHPSPEPVRKDLTAIGMSLPQAEVALADDSRPHLAAVLSGRNGHVTLG